MKRLPRLMLAALLSIFISPLQAETQNEMANSLNSFAFDIYHQLSSNEQNIIFSPYSLSSLLTMVSIGAAGDTQAQLLKVLHLTSFKPDNDMVAALNRIDASLRPQGSNTSGDFTLANALWADNNLTYKQAFLTIMQQSHSVQFFRLDFKNNPEPSRQKINDWVVTQTHGYIKDLLDKGTITDRTRLVLTNAIYFKGLWQLPFDSTDTSQQPFTLQNGSKVQVPMMQQTDKFAYGENDAMQMLELRYSKSPLAMMILLPKKGHSLAEVQKKLTPDLFQILLNTANIRNVILSMPKFQVESTFGDLTQNLEALGVVDAFSKKADFTNMAAGQILITGIVQKAMIQVDEKGTVAAAATGVMFGAALAVQPPPPVEFKADHPFLFVIYDQGSSLVLFMGQVTSPAA